ncbi:furin-like protease 1 [Schistocerca cancellata]|uniref:furin-like protease 1 n=1 Tax=Schistocerca cancellata TaxID=274614 RepID=UPI00211921B3|nr:furin-like protease 1 [Schistocerca cancellata]
MNEERTEWFRRLLLPLLPGGSLAVLRPVVPFNMSAEMSFLVCVPRSSRGVRGALPIKSASEGEVSIFPDLYHFQHNSVVKRSAEPNLEHHNNLLGEREVKWAKQQVVLSRPKRDLLPLSMQLRPGRNYRQTVLLNDPRWQQMWYLNRGHGLDMNVQGAWLEGITGRGVVVTILDDGLETEHPDLVRNYDPQASYDVNNHDEDPTPRYDLIDTNRHGTRCAGEVAAVANNSECAVGVAFGARVGGVRMLDGDVTDAVEARSLSLNPQHIDIYSASWGPDDDGKTVDGPGELATRAFIEGITKGRGGKGSIFVWASGNGGRDHDNCNCDGYTNSIWTLSISSATENGVVPWYSEACSSTLATTYSSGASSEKQVVTTDLHHQCTSSHTGTSASAPLAAGICALALEANRDLTWRDMQHIVVRTARPSNLHTPDWRLNGVGRNVSHSFGYGLMDATAMVRLARSWKPVPEQHRCEVSAPHTDKLIPAKSQVTLELYVKECAGVNYLEHVQAKISLVSSRRGDLTIHLTSPAGTRATLLARRPQDVSRAGFQDWPFMSVHTWGEQPFGRWTLEIHNEGRFLGSVSGWELVLHGTEQPAQPDDAAPATSAPPPPTAAPGTAVPRTRPPPSLPLGADAGKQQQQQQQRWPPYARPPAHHDNEVAPPPAAAPASAPDAAARPPSVGDAASSSASASGCVSLAKNGHGCLGCSADLWLLWPRSPAARCVAACPEQTFAAPPPGGGGAGAAPGVGTCEPCHYSCLACAGPGAGDCTRCHGDAEPRPSAQGAGRLFCWPRAAAAADGLAAGRSEW